MNLKRLKLLLAAAIVSYLSIAWVIKDTANPFQVFTGSQTTPTINAATDGTVTLGPTGSTVTHTVNGFIPAGSLTGGTTSMSNSAATAFGLKQYLHGTTYNGGNAPTITLGAGTVRRGIFIPYQMQDGSWRLRFNVDVTYPSAAGITWTVNSVTAKQVAGLVQAYTVSPNTAPDYVTGSSIFISANNTFYASTASGSTAASYSGDVELNAKPNWAY